MYMDSFVEQRMPEAGQSQLYREFIDLQQGSMTVPQYERKFNKLSNVVLSLNDTPLKKNEKFMEGMRADFQEQLTGHLHSPFTSLLDITI